MNALLGIAIPTYNRAEKLEIALENIVVQVNKSHDKERICVFVSDNGSNDSAIDVINKYRKIFEKNDISFFPHFFSYNRGFDENVLKCYEYCESEYVWFLSNDDHVLDGLLKQYLSPEQISGRLKLELGLEISHETIYKYIWEDKKTGGKIHKHLRNKGKRYRARGNKKDSRGRIKNAISIDQRPKIVEEKSRLGDWEIDTVIGKNHKGALVTIVDRKSKLTLMKKVSG